MTGEMKQAPQQLQALIWRLLEYEAGGRPCPEALQAGIEQVDQKLRDHLVRLIGPQGFDALMARAVTLAKTEVADLEEEARKASDGTLPGRHGPGWGSDPRAAVEGQIKVLAHFLWLLATLIGEDLTLRLVHITWPAITLNEAGPGSEKTSYE